MKQTYKYYWEDFPVGDVREIAATTVNREDMLRFSGEFDPQPFHVDEAAAAESIYGGLIASGWHTCSLAMRMMCDAYLVESASLGSPGMDSIKWLKPVRPGDSVRLRMTVLGARVLESKPHIGMIRWQWRLLNQNDERVMEMEGHSMLLRRPNG